MVRFSVAALVLTAGFAAAHPAAFHQASGVFVRQNCAAIKDQPGSQNVGTGSAQQFITGQCLSAADCASGCCVAQNDGSGECKNRIPTEERGATCDFVCGGASIPANAGNNGGAGAGAGGNTGNAGNNNNNNNNNAGNNNAGAGAGAGGQCANINTSIPGSQNVGTGSGTQFITGQCLSPADCASGCCVAQDSGIAECKAPLPTAEKGLSCDFTCGAAASSSTTGNTGSGNRQTGGGNNRNSNSRNSGNRNNNNNNNNSNNGAVTAPAAQGTCGNVDQSLSGSQNVGTGAGTQFITGQCFSPADCASGCCVAQSSGIAECKAPIPTAEKGLSCNFSCSA